MVVVLVTLYYLQLLARHILPGPAAAENLDPNQSAYKPYTPAEQALMDRENARLEALLQSAQADRAKKAGGQPETVRVKLSQEDYDAVLVRSLQARRRPNTQPATPHDRGDIAPVRLHPRTGI